jgi:hypothetical protein
MSIYPLMSREQETEGVRVFNDEECPDGDINQGAYVAHTMSTYPLNVYIHLRWR